MIKTKERVVLKTIQTDRKNDEVTAVGVWKDKEVSTIVTDIMNQNISSDLVTTNNVNITTTTVDKLTFQNISVFDALKQLAEISGFSFMLM